MTGQALRVRERIRSCTVEKGAAVVRFTGPVTTPRRLLAFYVLPAHAFNGTAIPEDHPFRDRAWGSEGTAERRTDGSVHYELASLPQAQPHIRTLEQRPPTNPKAALEAVLAGEAHGMVEVPLADQAGLQTHDDVALKTYDLLTTWYLALTTARPPLDDLRLRRAIDAAIGREQLAASLSPGGSSPNAVVIAAGGPFLSSSPGYDRALPLRPEADPEQAAKILTEAGFSLVRGRWSRDGAPLRLRLGIPTEMETRLPGTTERLVAALRAAHLDVQSVALGPGDGTGEVDLALRAFQHRLTDEELRGMLEGLDYADPELEAIRGRMARALTDSELQAAQRELHRLIAARLPLIPLLEVRAKSAWRYDVRSNIINPGSYWYEVAGWRYDRG